MIKRLLLAFLTVFIGAGMIVVEAEAKRMGGSRSLGMQRSTTPQKAAAAPQKAQPAAPNAAPQSSGWRRFAGPLMGLAAGLGLAALMSSLGLGAEFGGLLLALLIGGVLFFVLRRVLFKPQAQPAGANGAPYARQEHATPAFNQAATGGAATSNPNLPADFDAESFARQAKLNFIRLQAANDAGNIEDIRAFTSPEMFAEIKLDIDDRRGATQKTDVLDLSADVIDVEETDSQYIVSVRYTGLIREEADAAPNAIDEVWHLTKTKTGSTGWLVAGIQQLS